MAPLGNLVRLLPLNINELPSHPALEALVDSGKVSNVDANSRPDLITFVEEMLNEAASFVDDTLSDTFRKGSSKPSPPSKASVTLLSREIGDAEIQSIPWVNSTVRREFSAVGAKPREVWFARKSRHENLRAKGTADIAEFDYGLRQDHSKHEQEFTPDVFDAYKVLDWDDQIKALAEEGSKIGSHSDVSMSIFEMCHKLPAFLSNRTFPVLVITAKRGQHSMIVTQTPVDISNLTAVCFNNVMLATHGAKNLCAVVL